MHRHVDDRELQAPGAQEQLVITPAILNAPRPELRLDALPVAPP